MDNNQHSDEGFTFNWVKLIIGAVICYFWLFDDWLLLLSLVIVVFIHELGHVVIGKMFGCVIKEIQVFLLSFVSYKPKRVASANSWRNIKWSLGTLPLGGFTVFMQRSDMENTDVGLFVREDGTTTSPFIDDKPAWQRLLINAGGILFNLATFFSIYLLSPYLPLDLDHVFSAIMGLSLILVMLNILPVYPLDGGAIIFSCYEMVASKKPSPKFVKICGIIGYILIIVFFWIFPDWIYSYLDYIFNLFY